jgi:hypothetical protein
VRRRTLRSLLRRSPRWGSCCQLFSTRSFADTCWVGQTLPWRKALWRSRSSGLPRLRCFLTRGAVRVWPCGADSLRQPFGVALSGHERKRLQRQGSDRLRQNDSSSDYVAVAGIPALYFGMLALAVAIIVVMSRSSLLVISVWPWSSFQPLRGEPLVRVRILNSQGRLGVVPKKVVHPGLPGGWWLSMPPAPEEDPDEASR